MTAYFLRRLLLVPVTFLAVTFLVYAVTRVVPGGPIEQAQAARRMAAMQGEAGGGGGGLSRESGLMLDEEALRELQRFYALDQPVAIGYLQWLGAWPRPFRTRVPASTLEKHREAFQPLRELFERQEALRAELDGLLAPRGLYAYQGEVYRPLTEEEKNRLPQDFRHRAEELLRQGFGKRIQLLTHLGQRGLTYAGDTWYTRLEETPDHRELLGQIREILGALRLASEKLAEIERRYGFEVSRDGAIYRVDRRFSGILQLDFGRSYTHTEPVLPLIFSKFEISIVFGLTGFLLTWSVCVPLGVVKAVRHRTPLDTVTSVLVLLAYSIPGYVMAVLLLASAAGPLGLPLGGYKPPDAETLGWGQAILGRIRYMIIPVTAYVIGSFATMTMLMKNSMLEQLGADYVRTAFAKGLRERRVIFVHALRNSLIPVTAGLGNALGLLFAGSFLIEKTCNIPGMGLLGWEALLERDFPVVLGILVLGVLITLLGNILSDLLWALIDPRIRFGGERP